MITHAKLHNIGISIALNLIEFPKSVHLVNLFQSFAFLIIVKLTCASTTQRVLATTSFKTV